MRAIHVIPALLWFAIVACNGGDKTKTADSATTMSSDTSMHHMADSSVAVTALPAIPAGARVFFKNIKDGATVSSPLKVEMGVEGIGLDSAGAIKDSSGHHHLLIDAGDSISAGTVVPKDQHHLHFGKAQSSAEVTLAPGEHTLTLQYADGIHRSYGAKLSKSIKVKVK